MSSAQAFARVIRRLDSDWLPDQLEPEERIVIFDRKAGRVLAKKPFFYSARNIRYFLISTRRKSVECEGPVCRIKSTETGLVLEVAVRYEARCEKGHEERLAAAMGMADDPSALLNRFISDRVDDFVAGESLMSRDVCINFLEIRGALQAFVAERVRNELGISLAVVVYPKLEFELRPIPVNTGFFGVRLCDHDGRVDLKVVTELEVEPAGKMRAVLFLCRAKELEEDICQVIRRVLAEEVTLHSFTYELTSRVRRRLLDEVNERLAQSGRKIAYLQLESSVAPDGVTKVSEIEHTVPCKIVDSDDPIVIKHRLKLSLCNLGSFRASGVQDVEEWVTERLEEITRDVLFEKKYIDLLLDFRPNESAIKGRMEREMEEIGYAIKQLVTAPALEPLRWRSGFLLDDIEDTFGTRDSRIDVGLRIVVKGKIVNLGDASIQRYLTPRSMIFEDMRELVLRETRQIIHAVSPEHFYMRFAYSDNADQPSVREVIEARLSAVLAEQFAIQDIGIIPKPLETELTKRLERLQQGPHRVDIKCAPLNRGGEEVEYRIDYDVVGVPADGWYVFRAKNYTSTEDELDKIEGVIAEDMKSKLQVAPREILQFTELGRYHDLVQVLQRSVCEKIERVFGLRVQIINVNRMSTDGERKSQEVTKAAIETSMETGKHILDTKKADLLMLYGKRSELIKAGVEKNDPILMDVEERIRFLEMEVAPDQFVRGQQEVKALLPDVVGQDSRSEEWKRLAMGTSLEASAAGEEARLPEADKESGSARLLRDGNGGEGNDA